MGQHGKKRKGSQRLVAPSLGTGHGWAVAAVRKTHAEAAGVTSSRHANNLHKICKHHRGWAPAVRPLGSG